MDGHRKFATARNGTLIKIGRDHEILISEIGTAGRWVKVEIKSPEYVIITKAQSEPTTE